MTAANFDLAAARFVLESQERQIAALTAENAALREQLGGHGPASPAADAIARQLIAVMARNSAGQGEIRHA